jgi:peptidylprolyl isomerase
MIRVAVTMVVLGVSLFTSVAVSAQRSAAAGATVIVIESAKGRVEIETFPSDAPKSLARVLELVRANFYRGLRVHAVSAGIVEFGDPASRNMQRIGDWGFGGSGKRIGVKEVSKRAFERGVVGYVIPKDRNPEDADSQLFILKIGNPGLNGKYAAIGRVTVGMDVVDKWQRADLIKTVTIKGN